MAVIIYHNPKCSTSRHAVETAERLGVDAEIVNYTREPLDEPTLRALLPKLEDDTTDLIRRDALFKRLELTDADVDGAEQVVSILLEHPMLLQRPLIVTDDVAIIGRPKDRVEALLTA